MARRVEPFADLTRGRHLRLRFAITAYAVARRWRGDCTGTVRESWRDVDQADARLRTEHTAPIIRGEDPSRNTMSKAAMKRWRRRRKITCRSSRPRPRVLAYGATPIFRWPDTLQLNYAIATCSGSIEEHDRDAAMRRRALRHAMLLLPEISAHLGSLRSRSGRSDGGGAREISDFTSWRGLLGPRMPLQQPAGFDYATTSGSTTLREGHVGPIRDHLSRASTYQDKLTAFSKIMTSLGAASEFPWPQHRRAVITFLSPGLRFFHEGQFEGARVRVPDPSLPWSREPVDQEDRALLRQLLAIRRKAHFARHMSQICHSRPGPTLALDASSPVPGGEDDGVKSSSSLRRIGQCRCSAVPRIPRQTGASLMCSGQRFTIATAGPCR